MPWTSSETGRDCPGLPDVDDGVVRVVRAGRIVADGAPPAAPRDGASRCPPRGRRRRRPRRRVSSSGCSSSAGSLSMSAAGASAVAVPGPYLVASVVASSSAVSAASSATAADGRGAPRRRRFAAARSCRASAGPLVGRLVGVLCCGVGGVGPVRSSAGRLGASATAGGVRVGSVPPHPLRRFAGSAGGGTRICVPGASRRQEQRAACPGRPDRRCPSELAAGGSATAGASTTGAVGSGSPSRSVSTASARVPVDRGGRRRDGRRRGRRARR